MKIRISSLKLHNAPLNVQCLKTQTVNILCCDHTFFYYDILSTLDRQNVNYPEIESVDNY